MGVAGGGGGGKGGIWKKWDSVKAKAWVLPHPGMSSRATGSEARRVAVSAGELAGIAKKQPRDEGASYTSMFPPTST